MLKCAALCMRIETFSWCTLTATWVFVWSSRAYRWTGLCLLDKMNCEQVRLWTDGLVYSEPFGQNELWTDELVWAFWTKWNVNRSGCEQMNWSQAFWIKWSVNRLWTDELVWAFLTKGSVNRLWTGELVWAFWTLLHLFLSCKQKHGLGKWSIGLEILK